MPPKRKKGLSGVVGVGRALEADEQSLQEQEQLAPVPSKNRRRDKERPAYRGKARADGQALRTVSITLPADVLTEADTYVVQRKQVSSGYNRSALIEEALRAFLARTKKP